MAQQYEDVEWGAWRIHLLDVETMESTELFAGVPGTFAYPSISGDGRFVTFTSNANLDPIQVRASRGDVYVHDRSTGETALLTRSRFDGDSNIVGDLKKPAVSPDGRYIAFSSKADDLVAGDINGLADVFLVENPLY
jgi:Tol biopolymer transport system component